MAGNLADIITCAKFQDEIFRGYDFTGGRISHFPIDFRMGLTVQRDCAACDLYSVVLGFSASQRSEARHLLSECLSVCLPVRPTHPWVTP